MCRFRRLLLLAALGLALAWPLPAHAQTVDTGLCPHLPGFLQRVYCRPADPNNPATRHVPDYVAPVKEGFVHDQVRQWTSLLAEVAVDWLGDVYDSVNRSSAPDLNAQWFRDVYNLHRGTALKLIALTFAIAVSAALLRMRGADLGQALVGGAIAVILIVAIPKAVTGYVGLMDRVAMESSASMANNARQFLERMGSSTSSVAALSLEVGKVLISALAVLLAVVAAGIAKLLLTGRTWLIYAATVMGVLTVVLLTFSWGEVWGKRLLSFVGLLGFAIIPIVVIASLALGALGRLGTKDVGADELFGASVALGIAGLSPLALAKFLPFVGLAVASNLKGATRAATGPISSGVHYAQRHMQRFASSPPTSRPPTPTPVTPKPPAPSPRPVPVIPAPPPRPPFVPAALNQRVPPKPAGKAHP